MKLQPALIFGEHMILQRDQKIRIWGTSAENDTVTVRLHDQCASSVTVRGNWMVELNEEKACERTSMTISSRVTEETITFNDVAIGEVWLAGGQSNMEFIMKYDVNCEETMQLDDDDSLRYLCYPHVAFNGFLEFESMPAEGFWRKWTTAENRKQFSAIGAYMALILRKKLNVPVGIIGCNWGGSPAAAWTDIEDVRNNPAMAEIIKWHEDACNNTNWAKYISASDIRPAEQTPEQKDFNDRFMMGEDMSEFFRNFDPSKLPPVDFAPYNPGPRSIVRPGGLYENMLKKVAPYSIRGVIWYQGEDDDARNWADFYDESMVTMINSWRKLWGWDFPFYQIELAPFQGISFNGAKKYALMRHLQHEASERLKDVTDICILDAGDRMNVHPRRKKMVGERLGRIVMKHTYGDDSLTADCPVMKEAVRNNDEIAISFENAAEGMVINGNIHMWMTVRTEGRDIAYEADVKGNVLTLHGDFRDRKIRIEYCETNYCEAVLYNSEGNPAFGFTLEV